MSKKEKLNKEIGAHGVYDPAHKEEDGDYPLKPQEPKKAGSSTWIPKSLTNLWEKMWRKKEKDGTL